MTVSWNIDPGEYLANLTRQRADAIEADLVAFVDSMTEQVSAWMKENHRWQNQSGNAEAALYADIEHVVHQTIYLLMSHGPAIEYAWILEANPRTTLLGDATDHWWPVLYRGAVEIVRRYSD